MIPRFLRVCDICHIYDNSDVEPVRIIRKHKKQLNIFPNERWSVRDIKSLMGIE